jgi:iron complex transport system permease protein
MKLQGSDNDGSYRAAVSYKEVETGRITMEGGDNLFAQQVDAGHKVEPRVQRIWVLAIVLLALYVVANLLPRSVLSQTLLTDGYGFTDWVLALQSNASQVMAALTFQQYDYEATKLLVVALAGAGLGLTGAVYQGSLKNSLASPSTLGIMSGAQLGALIYVLLFVSGADHVLDLQETLARQTSSFAESFSAFYGQAFFSMGGCALVALLLWACVKLAGKQGVSNILLVVLGQIIGSTAAAVIAIARYYYLITDEYGTKSYAIQNLMAASFYRQFGPLDIAMITIPLLIVFLYIMKVRSRLSLLAFQEDEARAMGADMHKTRIAMVTSCTALTAIIVSLCGVVGFVGFLVPHLTRRIVGPDFRYQIPASALMGAVFVLACFTVVSVIDEDYSTAVGMFISLAGGVVFLVTALRRKDMVGDGRF